MNNITLYFDGSSRPHKGGPAEYGFKVPQTGYSETGQVPDELGNTNNVAEYYALIQGVRYCLRQRYEKVHIIGDSQLIVYQVTGQYKVKNAALQQMNRMALGVLAQLPSWSIQWVRREFNEADAVSRTPNK